MGLDAGITMTAKTSIVATLASFGVFTTGLLTWFTQPYVQRLRYDPTTDMVETTTLTLLARPRTDRFHLNEVTEADSVHPLTSFAARGRKYYVDAQNFPNKELLVKLVPQAAAAHAVEAANAEQQQQQQQQQSSEQQQQAPPQ
ncbi:transmembrane mitochondrial [Chlorella sorokiniana]|uniref:Transmembrane mitochondrial n=1 Tax=Chlorella sorokiniana TaxID=3076 RepID=A0A2P6TZM1_CHLSO|nr:transmembrane mitochondrial [Chlorella sorokiniana]|eukprot:PRW59509.1 transmembrane mitochondrial [Chlorella sorokiniana]